MYYGARYYDPTIGRFISADTIVPNPANPQSLNRYSYVRNNPIRYTDPSGHGADCVNPLDDPANGCVGGSLVPEFVEDVATVVSSPLDLAVDVGDATWDMGWEFGEYKIDRIADDFRDIVLDPDGGDIVELLTMPLEEFVNDLGAAVGILGGGDVIAGDAAGSDCPIGATCIQDASWLPFGYVGQAFNEVLVTTSTASSDTILHHEPQHFYDAEQYGWGVYGLAYAFNGLRHLIGGGSGYRDNVFEVRARQAEVDDGRQPGWGWKDLLR